MRTNCNFVTVVSVPNDKRCLVHNLHVKTLGFLKDY